MVKKRVKRIVVSVIIGFFLSLFLLEICLYLGGVLFTSSQENLNKITLQKKDAYRILGLGDSTTAIGGKNSWPSQLEEVLNNKNLGKEFSVINKGVVLVDSEGILSSLPSNLEEYSPEMVIIMAGLNDAKKEYSSKNIFYKTKFFLKRFRVYRLLEQLRPEIFNVEQIDYDNTEKAYKNPVTIYNFNKIKEILDEKKIKLVIMQYPLMDAKPLKRMFSSKENIIFVDNEKIFKDRLEHSSYEEYFVDKFAGDFGHCTEKGNRLIAENIANVIFEE